MANNKIPYLCGGVLFFLITQAKPAKGTAREHTAGIKDNHNAPTVMADLVYAVTGQRGIETAKDTSKYRECLNSGSVNVPFNEIAVSDSYDNEVKNKYSVALKRMSEFVDCHISSTKMEWLVKALLEIIETDESILDTECFYIQPTGEPVSKAEIINMTEFVMPAFLVGVMHYIETNRYDKNECGVDTLEFLGEKKYRKERRYTGKLGTKIERIITVKCEVHLDDISEINECTVVSREDKSNVQKKDAHSILEEKICVSAQAVANEWQKASAHLAEDKIEQKEAEVVDNDMSGAADKKGKVVHQTIVNQYGDHPIHIDHVENLKM